MNSVVRRLAERLIASPKSKNILGHRFSACAPASPEQLAAAELVIGHPLPPILREIYGSVANGGFGPGYGVMGVAGGFTDDQGKTIVSRYQCFRENDPEDPSWQWESEWVAGRLVGWQRSVERGVELLICRLVMSEHIDQGVDALRRLFCELRPVSPGMARYFLCNGPKKVPKEMPPTCAPLRGEPVWGSRWRAAPNSPSFF